VEEKQESPWLGCLAIVVLIGLVGSCVMGGDDETATDTGSSTDLAMNAPEQGLASSQPQPAETAQTGINLIEQAILDAFPEKAPKTTKGREKASNAKDYVGVAINSKGYLCAQAVEARQAAPGQYGIGCVVNRDGTGAAIYLLDVRNGNVTPIG